MTAAVHTIREIRERVAPERRAGRTIALVPTMGSLHAGHGRLIERARKENDCVVVSIFVNPIQFNQSSDYERYPRDITADLEFCSGLGADLVFAPEVKEMYPETQATTVDVDGLTEQLCGRFRPGHFRGVTTVVAKLFNIVQPDRAYFGQKDAQQLAAIRRMVSDLNMPVEIVAVPTVREADGLALSSRNRHLNPEERRSANLLYKALSAARAAVESGETRPDEVKRRALDQLGREPAIRLEYLEVVNPSTVQPVGEISGTVLIALAAWLGVTRLIDNVVCDSPRTAASASNRG